MNKKIAFVFLLSALSGVQAASDRLGNSTDPAVNSPSKHTTARMKKVNAAVATVLFQEEEDERCDVGEDAKGKLTERQLKQKAKNNTLARREARLCKFNQFVY